MYQKSSGLTKFVILFFDCICMAFSLFVADFIWHDLLAHGARRDSKYFTLLLMMLGVNVLVFLFTRTFGNFYVRGYLLEAWAVVENNAFMMLGVTLILFVIKRSAVYSRMVIAIFAVLNCVLTWIVHIALKKLLPFVYKKMVAKRNAIIVGSSDFVKDIVRELKITKDYAVEIVGMSLTGGENQEEIAGVPSISSVDELTEFCKSASVDEVIVEIKESTRSKLMPIIDELASAGIIIKYRAKLPAISNAECQAVSHAGEYFVATYATRSVSTGSLLLKRIFDIVAGAVGSLVTVILMIFIAPAIVIESKGPVLFSQKRVGKNGRTFTIYKFRSMYADAEERKKELMSQNELDGLVFKMEDDPRITKVGKFLRKTSLDEFPQFFNVLKGDMSMVGTRPPTMDEFEKYNLSQKGRLSFRPGLTGLWQVSGRNNIKSFEKIVELDKTYIQTWSPLLDLKIILKTIPEMFSGR